MLSLWFDWKDLSKEDLFAHLHRFKLVYSGQMLGQPIHFGRRDRDNPYHYYTFTDREVLVQLADFLRERVVKFDVVGEDDLPEYARQFIAAFKAKARAAAKKRR